MPPQVIQFLDDLRWHIMYDDFIFDKLIKLKLLLEA